MLSETLNSLIRGWRAVEGPLNLDSANGGVFQRPPEDYTPVLPNPAMGSVLGYQYSDDSERPNDMGQLRFFRCTGVGRWALLNLHRLFGADSPTGPAVLLMSGTSWAGTSPRYDIQLPVNAVLLAPDDELAGIGNSEFFFDVVHDNRGPVVVSGKRGQGRRDALKTIVHSLAAKPRPDLPSKFEAELDLLPEDRRRIVLVVGSYREAREVAEDLVELRGDWRGQALHLVADESEFTSYWQPALRRGDVSRLAGTNARFLVAPLLAIERGHNILNQAGEAAIGSAYFLVRPHPTRDFDETPQCYGVAADGDRVGLPSGLFRLPGSNRVFASVAPKPASAQSHGSPMGSRTEVRLNRNGIPVVETTKNVFNPQYVELTVAACRDGDDPVSWAALAHVQRNMSDAYQDTLTLPGQLHLARKATEYAIPDTAADDNPLGEPDDPAVVADQDA